jgi:DNA-binding transcriptional ArsR family regulator
MEIVYSMVKYEDAAVGRTFSALSDPTRRAILARLTERDTFSVSELAEPFGVTLPAILKHLDVLSEAGLVARHKVGRTVTCQLKAGPMEDAVNWLNRYQRYWNEKLDRLAAFVENDTCLPNPTPNQASPSSAASTPRRKRSSPRGRTRRK